MSLPLKEGRMSENGEKFCKCYRLISEKYEMRTGCSPNVSSEAYLWIATSTCKASMKSYKNE